MNQLDRLVTRLKKIDIELSLVGNFPWIYLDRINGKRVTEKYLANHGFTIGWYPVKPGQDITVSNLSEVFRVIRKYI